MGGEIFIFTIMSSNVTSSAD